MISAGLSPFCFALRIFPLVSWHLQDFCECVAPSPISRVFPYRVNLNTHAREPVFF